MPPKRHARLGASKSERWMNCPGSVASEEKVPASAGSSPYAREGTAAHEVAEMALNSGKDAIDFIGEMIVVEEHPIEVTEEMCDAVQVFLSHVRKVARGGQLMVEQKFDLSPLKPPDEMFGTSDAVIWKHRTKHLIVCDYKHGRGVAVDATENTQLAMYGIGSVLMLGKKPKKITLTIVQPRASHPEGAVRSHDYTYEELVAFKKRLFEAAAETKKPNARLQVGDWCRFCRAQPICPAQHSMAVTVAQTEFDVMEAEPQLPSPEVLSDEQVAAILHHIPNLKAWLSSIEAYVHGRISQGEEFPGYKLVAKRATRKWKNPDEALRELKKHLGEQAYKKTPLSPAQAEKALKGVGKRLKEDLFEKKSSGANLVPESDPRPALVGAAADDFTTEEPENEE